VLLLDLRLYIASKGALVFMLTDSLNVEPFVRWKLGEIGAVTLLIREILGTSGSGNPL